MTPPHPPARLSERTFRRFEKVIYEAVTHFPNPFVLKVASPNATACQLRNAMKSLYHFQWETIIPHNAFLTLYESKAIVVREKAGEVVIGDKYTTKDQHFKEFGSIIEPHSGPYPSVDTTMLVAWAMCDLSAKGCLSQPILLLNLRDEVAEELQRNYDVSLEKLGANDWLLT